MTARILTVCLLLLPLLGCATSPPDALTWQQRAIEPSRTVIFGYVVR